MPFTLSHPAAVVPLARRGLPFSALVVGSMTPDFPYFLVPSAMFGFGHTIKGVFEVCLPLGLLALWLFHQFFKLPLLSLLPVGHRVRLVPYSREIRCQNLRDFLVIGAGILIGAFTHTVWDSFTHYSGWLYEKLPVLRTPLYNTADSAIFIFDFLQYGSTLFGGLFLIYCYLRWYQGETPGDDDVTFHLSDANRMRFVIGAILVALGVAFISSFDSVQPISITRWVQPLARHIGVAVIRVGALELLFYCGFWQWMVRRKVVLESVERC